MHFRKLNETIELKKYFLAGTTITESDYSLYSILNGNRKYLSPPTITFSVVQPTEIAKGHISFSLTITPSWDDGLYIFTLEKTIADEGVQWWTKRIASASVYIQKYNNEIVM